MRAKNRAAFCVMLLASSAGGDVEEAPASGLAHTSKPTIAVVFSYDNAYPWQGQIHSGIAATLEGRAELVYHEMDTLGVSDPQDLADLGSEALAWLDTIEPDAVIVADDNAMRYVAMELAGSTELPLVFCGVNWPASTYDLPRAGLHGMVEISPAENALDLLSGTLEPGATLTILGVDRPTDRAQADGFIRTAESRGYEAEAVLVTDFATWAEAFERAQQASSFVYLLNNAGIPDWDDDAALALTGSSTTTLTATEYQWMGQFATFSVTKRGEEQGRWAAEQSLLYALRPEYPQGPVVVNREVVVSVNTDLLEASGLGLPRIFSIVAEDPQ